MPLEVAEVTDLQNYLLGVVNRADHHADNVRYVVLPLVGAMLLFKDVDRPIQVRTHAGSPANVLWVHIGGAQYVFSYDHEARSIVVKRGTVRGEVLERFTNSTTVPEILRAFETLRTSA